MKNNWYDTKGWYAPLNSDSQDDPVLPGETAIGGGEQLKTAASGKKRGKTKKKGLTPARIAGLILLLLLVIAGSSIAFRQLGSGSDAVFFGDSGEIPDDPESFFKQYYEAVEGGSAKVNVPAVEARPEFTIELQPSDGEELGLQDLYERCAPTIVSISAYQDGKMGYSWGSGVIISEDGLVLTNCHVLEDCDSAVVTLSDGTEYDALLVGADAISDVALLKIEAKGLPVAMLGESNQLRVGDRVAAIGNPLGETFRNTLTDGIISAIERGMTYNGRSMTLLQTNTAINEGNSGGALFNLQGQVIGITNMKMMSSYSSIEGIGFAIPSATVCTVVNALVRDGEVKGRPSIGITVGAIPDTAKEKYTLPDGLYVMDVSDGSDAKEKGIKQGDVITAVNGTPVTTTDEISDIKNEMQVGDTIVLTVWRDGSSMEISVVLVDTNDIYG
ncbi:MAG: trypsin-like peptidase domain-containing protein [Oscillospiraceae bacterium]|nr:trypsin-like peptidase domain-containing protein [Oscillospiraceae bacterium]